MRKPAWICINTRVEGGNTPDDYDTGRIATIDRKNGTCMIMWDTGVSTIDSWKGLRRVGTFVPTRHGA